MPKPDHHETLSEEEIFWRDSYDWLVECGYRLRDRYKPGWTPSWLNGGKRNKWAAPDHPVKGYGPVLDGTRISDGKYVMLKLVERKVHPCEDAICRFLSSDDLMSDPHNHTVPIFDILDIPHSPGRFFIVMPLLRRYNDPEFETIGEAVEFFQQFLEGLHFMHKHRVAHRDCNGRNVMMDAAPLYPQHWHPIVDTRKRDMSATAEHLTRTQKPVKYYFIDFGISRQFTADDPEPMADPIQGGDRTVPEFEVSDEPCNPFPTDVYYAGNLIRQDFISGRPNTTPIDRHRRGLVGFDFMKKLVADMVQEDPSKRPTMHEVVTRFNSIRGSLSKGKLRCKIIFRSDLAPVVWYKSFMNLWRRIIPA